MQEPMNDEYREEVIATLVLWTGWNRQAFDKMDDRELLAEYDRRVGK